MASIFEYGSTPVQRRAVRKGKTANFTIPLPAGARPVGFYIKNNTANAVTDGIRVGSAAAGTQHVTAQAVAANALVYVPATLVSPIVQTEGLMYVEAVTAWNGANLDVVAVYDEVLDGSGPGAK